MLGRVAFLSGWIFGYFVHRNPLDIALVTAETSALRVEISQAREAVDQLSKGRLVCEWEVWWHKWCLRLNGIFDLLLVSWIVWTRFWSRPRPALSIQADTGGSSSSDRRAISRGNRCSGNQECPSWKRSLWSWKAIEAIGLQGWKVTIWGTQRWTLRRCRC